MTILSDDRSIRSLYISMGTCDDGPLDWSWTVGKEGVTHIVRAVDECGLEFAISRTSYHAGPPVERVLPGTLAMVSVTYATPEKETPDGPS